MCAGEMMHIVYTIGLYPQIQHANIHNIIRCNVPTAPSNQYIRLKHIRWSFDEPDLATVNGVVKSSSSGETVHVQVAGSMAMGYLVSMVGPLACGKHEQE